MLSFLSIIHQLTRLFFHLLSTQDKSCYCLDCKFQTCHPSALLRHRRHLHGYTPGTSYEHVPVRVIRGATKADRSSGVVPSQKLPYRDGATSSVLSEMTVVPHASLHYGDHHCDHTKGQTEMAAPPLDDTPHDSLPLTSWFESVQSYHPVVVIQDVGYNPQRTGGELTRNEGNHLNINLQNVEFIPVDSGSHGEGSFHMHPVNPHWQQEAAIPDEMAAPPLDDTPHNSLPLTSWFESVQSYHPVVVIQDVGYNPQRTGGELNEGNHLNINPQNVEFIPV